MSFGAQRRELLVGERLEQEQGAQLVGVTWELGHDSARYRCTNITAIDPSPTAAATRLAESARTSPATKTPGTLVSRWWGGRSNVQPHTFRRSGPVRMKPRPSRATTPSSQSVRGAAPMKMNIRAQLV